MANIGGEIINGMLHALWALISVVPVWVYLIIFVALCAVIAVMRVATNWKVDVVLIGVAALVAIVFYYREHWIEMGRLEDQAKVTAAQALVAGYKKTNGLIETCYARNTSASFLWDRTQGKCLRADGAVE